MIAVDLYSGEQLALQNVVSPTSIVGLSVFGKHSFEYNMGVFMMSYCNASIIIGSSCQ